ncbi:MAG: hypothetical protein LW833_06140 [Hyphomicrobiales bacterium]|nr:hypothetical protein [Hyphomicrobiales bacterium]
MNRLDPNITTGLNRLAVVVCGAILLFGIFKSGYEAYDVYQKRKSIDCINTKYVVSDLKEKVFRIDLAFPMCNTDRLTYSEIEFNDLGKLSVPKKLNYDSSVNTLVLWFFMALLVFGFSRMALWVASGFWGMK